MKIRIAAATLAAAALAASSVAAPATARTAEDQRVGTKSLAKVLAADGTEFDSNWKDFDVVERAVLDVLAAKPKSPVAILTKGKKRVTAFLPTDRAFRSLVAQATGTAPATEEEAYTTLAALAQGTDLVETVLLYHVVPGQTLTYRQLKKANGDKLTTAQGGDIKVKVKGKRVTLVDLDPNDRNPRVIVPRNINKGNRQIAHAINAVLRPLDLQPPPPS